VIKIYNTCSDVGCTQKVEKEIEYKYFEEMERSGEDFFGDEGCRVGC
jgi:hypothetical protein